MDNISKLMDICIENNVKGIIFYGIGLTLREGNREYFYSCLDKDFPGLKEQYINEYKDSYIVTSKHNEELSSYIIEQCKKHHIMCDNDEVFAYLREYPDKYKQMKLF